MATCLSGEYSYCLRWSSTGLARIFLCQELTLINSPSSSRVRPVGFWVCLTCLGGALSRFTVFALGIMPYISASIVMQLLTMVSAQLEALKKEGQAGQRK